MSIPTVTLRSGQQMPVVGLGTWQATEGSVEGAIETAIDVGYRLFDTAWNYRNETNIGVALSRKLASGAVKRDELFIVTKLPMIGHRPDRVREFLEDSLKSLQLDYIDLYLIHLPVALKYQPERNPFPRDADGRAMLDHADLLDTWRAMEECAKAGLAKAIGVSNFSVEQLERISKIATVPISAQQIECHAYLQQEKQAAFCKAHGIAIMAYAPIGSPGRISPDDKVLMDDPVVLELAAKYGKTAAQICLRFLVQCGHIVIPKSSNEKRLRENFEIFDFSLSDDDMTKIKAINRNDRYFGKGPFWQSLKDHPENPFKDEFPPFDQ